MRVLTDKNGKPLLDANGNILLAPSNEKLIFTGGEEKTYDGSEEVEIHLSDVKSVSAGGVALTPDENGNVNIPYVSQTSAGLVRLNESSGLRIFNNTLRIYAAYQQLMDNRNNATPPFPITPSVLDYAVKAAMCDGKGAAWTEAEQKAACARSGAVYDGQFELIEEITLTEDVSSIERIAEPNGTAYNFDAVICTVRYPSNINAQNYFSFGKNRPIGGTGANPNGNAMRATIRKLYGTWDISCYAGLSTNESRVQGPVSCDNLKFVDSEWDYIGYIRMYAYNSAIPSGTKIKIYGVRA